MPREEWEIEWDRAEVNAIQKELEEEQKGELIADLEKRLAILSRKEKWQANYYFEAQRTAELRKEEWEKYLDLQIKLTEEYCELTGKDFIEIMGDNNE